MHRVPDPTPMVLTGTIITNLTADAVRIADDDGRRPRSHQIQLGPVQSEVTLFGYGDTDVERTTNLRASLAKAVDLLDERLALLSEEAS